MFPLEEAAKRGTIIQMLVSDAAQKAIWPTIKECLNEGDALYFSHGFSIVYKDQTGVIPPDNVDVILVAPKGSGLNVRRNFLSGAGINSNDITAFGEDFQAGGIAAVFQIRFARNRNRASGSPACDFHFEPFNGNLLLE